MKHILSISVIFTMTLTCHFALAQNVPDNTTPPTAAASGNIPYPLNFNSSPNTAPARLNYSRVYTPIIPLTSIPAFDVTKNSPIVVNTTYGDGFGRPLINIIRNNSTKDIVTPYTYRSSDTAISYLPYADTFHSKFHSSVYTRQFDYYKNPYTSDDGCAYSKSFAKNPSGIPTSKSYLPGVLMVDNNKGTTTTGDFNDSDIIYIFDEDSYNSSTDNICYSGTYSANELQVIQSTSVHGEKTISYSDRNNKLICQKVYAGGSMGNSGWLTTYYVYNELGSLVYTLPPKACQKISSSCLDSAHYYCFFYDYDEKGNLISKHLPGRMGDDIAVYNRYNQLVLSRTPNMTDSGKWHFTIYDKLNREIISGIYTGSEALGYWRGVAVGDTTPVTHVVSSLNVPENQTLEYWLLNDYVTGSYPSSLYGCEVHVYNYYDNYDNAPANTTSFASSYSSAYLSATGIETPIPYNFVQGKLVASKVRILDNGIINNFTNTPWITTIYFYDDKDRLIQSQTLNPWNKWDTTTIQYNFADQPVLNLSTYHAWSGLDKPDTKIYTRYTYGPKTGRPVSVDQMTDADTVWHAIVAYEYDDLGRMKTKWLGGDAGGTAEEQHFKYNIRGQLTGINSDQWGLLGSSYPTMTYASRLLYEYGFDSARFDGRLSGYYWQSRSSEQKAYGYLYDSAGRMKYADYNDESLVGGMVVGWNKTNHDYTVSNLNYDASGNILAMKQRGPDTNIPANPADIDDFTYTYEANRLMKVTDAGANSPLHDFDNGSSGTSNDYTYDHNGNLTWDENKEIATSYNFLDKPIKVVHSTDSFENIYDATGRLLEKRIIENNDTVTWCYWGPFVFKNDSIQYIYHQEGRSRWLADSSFFKYDFFVRDHQGNVRTVVTEDISQGLRLNAGFEMMYANIEESAFDNIAVVRDNNPYGSPDDLMSARLNGGESDHRVGASVLVHAMAGDQLNMSAYGYYEDTDSTDMNTYATPESMLTALSGALNGGTSLVGENAVSTITSSTISGLLTSTNYSAYDAIKNSITDIAYPRMYLNYLVFDEEMNLVPDECQVIQISGGPNAWHELHLANDVTMKGNGFVLGYLSCESSMDVWADHVHFITIKGRLLQEQHYYPHGLVIEAGQDNSQSPNQHLFEGNELHHELGLELSNFNFRDYDQQIGMFTSIDPLADVSGQERFSPYHFVGNDPANYTDPIGLLWVFRPRNDKNQDDQPSINASLLGFLCPYFTEPKDLSGSPQHPMGGGGGGDMLSVRAGMKLSNAKKAELAGLVSSRHAAHVDVVGDRNRILMARTKDVKDQHLSPDATALSFTTTLMGLTGHTLSVNIGLVGNDLSIWGSYSPTVGTPEVSVGVGVVAAWYDGKTPSLSNFVGTGGHGVSAGWTSFSGGYSSSGTNGNAWDSYQGNVNVSSRDILPFTGTVNYSYNNYSYGWVAPAWLKWFLMRE